MPRQTSHPGMMVAGGVVFLLMPFLWARANGTPFSWKVMAVGVLIAVLFFYLAAKYSRQRRGEDAPPPTA